MSQYVTDFSGKFLLCTLKNETVVIKFLSTKNRWPGTHMRHMRICGVDSLCQTACSVFPIVFYARCLNDSYLINDFRPFNFYGKFCDILGDCSLNLSDIS